MRARRVREPASVASENAVVSEAWQAVRPPRGRAAAYPTLLLALVFMLAAMDRNVLSILLVPIRRDLHASDVAMGALTGIAFSLVYATAALPIARLADRGNRRNLLAVAVALWGVMTSACGFATSYLGLALARTGVAIGEAAHQPASMSMIADLHPPARRGIATSCLTIGSAVGVGLGAAIAGSLSDLHGWRSAFLALGLPGLILALVLVFTTKEPARKAHLKVAAGLSTRSSLANLLRIATFRRLMAAQVLMQGGVLGFQAWAPAYLMRVHHLSATEMSLKYGASASVSSILGLALAGWLSDRLSLGGERRRATFSMAAVLVGTPPMVLTALASSSDAAFVGFFFQVFAGAGAASSALALSLAVVPANQRGLMTAVLTFCVSVVGGGLGPLLVGAISDHLANAMGPESIRAGLLLPPALIGLSSLAFYAASRTADLDAAKAI